MILNSEWNATIPIYWLTRRGAGRRRRHGTRREGARVSEGGELEQAAACGGTTVSRRVSEARGALASTRPPAP